MALWISIVVLMHIDPNFSPVCRWKLEAYFQRQCLSTMIKGNWQKCQLIVCVHDYMYKVAGCWAAAGLMTGACFNINISSYLCGNLHYGAKIGADSRFAPSQWETALLCNDICHWLGTNLESALKIVIRLSFLPTVVTLILNMEVNADMAPWKYSLVQVMTWCCRSLLDWCQSDTFHFGLISNRHWSKGVGYLGCAWGS